MTEKLYEQDSYRKTFEALVLDCQKMDKGYAVKLDRTAFFPGGGGQAVDTGEIEGIRVSDVQEISGDICHITERPLPIGERVTGKIDWESRFRRMQNHSGEHVVSGLIARIYGYRNVGFHMGNREMQVDIDGYLSPEQLAEIELEANYAVCGNAVVTAGYPEPEELLNLSYRSKRDDIKHVRIVEIEGYDRCACCAPHVRRTGEIGLIKILDSTRYKGGTRLFLLCGYDALEAVGRRIHEVKKISELLSVPQEDASSAVERVLGNLTEAKRETACWKDALIGAKLDAAGEENRNLVFFETVNDAEYLQRLAEKGSEKCRGVCAVFSGDDEVGYRFVLISSALSLKTAAKDFLSSFDGRGGGSDRQIQGSVRCTRADIDAYFAHKEL